MMRARLTRGKWLLGELGGHVVTGDSVPFLSFDPSGLRVSGFAGCNRLTGRYRTGDQQLIFSGLVTTRKYCAKTGALERSLLAALEQTRQARVTRAELELRDATGGRLAWFRACA